MSAVDVTDRAERRGHSPFESRNRGRRLLGLGAFVLCLLAFFAPAPGLASYPAISIAQITTDDDGRLLNYPSSVFYDPIEEEIYLVNGGSARVVVYGPDFYPRVSIGAGRGVFAPRGMHVAPDGRVYVTQSRSAANPTPRITILNAAFFVDREILLDDIPNLANFSPGKLAVSRDGLIYLTGESSRGVIVLDGDGTFLRMLEPMDVIADREAVAAAAERLAAQQDKKALEDEIEARQRSRGDIPEEFRPRSRQQEEEARSGPGLGPVRVRNVVIDRAGNLYLVSAETSKVYVYSADETFLFSFGEKGGGPRRLSQPRGLVIDEERGLIYVADFMRHTILAYNLSGRFQFEVGGRGEAPGWFNFPSDLAINREGQLIVSDLFNRRVQVLDVDYIPEFPLFSAPPPPAQQSGEESEAVEAMPEEDAPTSDDDFEGEEIVEEIVEEFPPADFGDDAEGQSDGSS